VGFSKVKEEVGHVKGNGGKWKNGVSERIEKKLHNIL